MKKFLSSLLAFAITLSLVSVPFASAADIDETYDETVYTEDFEAVSGTVDGAPDGTKYFVPTEQAHYIALSAVSSDDYMWELDLMFPSTLDAEAAGTGFTVRNGSNWNGSIRLNGTNLAVQTASSSFTTIAAVERDTWYHVQLFGRYGGDASRIDLSLYKWNGAEKEFIITAENIATRNNRSSDRITVEGGTAVDNLKVTKLGADTINVTSINTDLNCSESTPLAYTASRNGISVLSPAVTWEVYNEDNTAPLDDSNITVSDGGLLSTTAQAQTQTINVRATSQDKGNPYGSVQINIKHVDISSAKFDTLELSTDDAYVNADTPLKIDVEGSKNGSPVEIESGDIVWSVFDKDNILPIANKFINISEDGTVTVESNVIAQNVNIHATDTKTGAVVGSLPIYIKSSDARETGDEGRSDLLIASDSCDSVVTGTNLEIGSWDGSNYYVPTIPYHFPGFEADTTEDMYIEADLQFNADGQGWTVRNAGNGKEGLQVIADSGNLCIVQDSSKRPVQFKINYGEWYKIGILAKTGLGDGSYAALVAYKYDENGDLVNPLDSSSNLPFIAEGIPMRNIGVSAANHISIAAGTGVDNYRMLRAMPDELKVSTDIQTVFAGGQVQAICKATRQGVEMKNIDFNTISWAVYDSENKELYNTDLFTIDANGLMKIDPLSPAQEVYIRVISTDDSDFYDSIKVTVESSVIFEVENIAHNEEKTKILALDIHKNFAYSDSVVIIMATYDTNGKLTGIYTKNVQGNTLLEGQTNEVKTNFTLPQGFDFENDLLKAFIWTGLNAK